MAREIVKPLNTAQKANTLQMLVKGFTGKSTAPEWGYPPWLASLCLLRY